MAHLFGNLTTRGLSGAALVTTDAHRGLTAAIGGTIARGPDGAMWFTNQNGNSIGRITT